MAEIFTQNESVEEDDYALTIHLGPEQRAALYIGEPYDPEQSDPTMTLKHYTGTNQIVLHKHRGAELPEVDATELEQFKNPDNRLPLGRAHNLGNIALLGPSAIGEHLYGTHELPDEDETEELRSRYGLIAPLSTDLRLMHILSARITMPKQPYHELGRLTVIGGLELPGKPGGHGGIIA